LHYIYIVPGRFGLKPFRSNFLLAETASIRFCSYVVSVCRTLVSILRTLVGTGSRSTTFKELPASLFLLGRNDLAETDHELGRNILYIYNVRCNNIILLLTSFPRLYGGWLDFTNIYVWYKSYINIYYIYVSMHV